jgi:hypothetical protein
MARQGQGRRLIDPAFVHRAKGLASFEQKRISELLGQRRIRSPFEGAVTQRAEKG